MRRLFAAPVFADAELTQRARTLFFVAWSTIGIVVVVMTAITITQPELIARTATPVFVIAALCLLVLILNRRGQSWSGSAILVGGLVILVTATALTAGGIRSPGVTMYCVFSLMAGVLMGLRAGAFAGAACGALALGLVFLEMSGNLPESRVAYSAVTYWLLVCLYISLVVVLLRVATITATRGWRQAQSELNERRRAERHLDLALDAGAVGIWNGDLRGTHLQADRRSFETLGLPVSTDGSFAIEAWLACVSEKDLPRLRQTIMDLANGLPLARIEYDFRRPDTGALRRIEGTAAAVRDETGKLLSHAGTVRDVTVHHTGKKEREELLLNIRERMKELHCLYRVLDLATNETLDEGSICDQIAKLLPGSLLHAETATARIVLGDAEYRSETWTAPVSRLCSPVTVDGKDIGFVEIGYNAVAPDAEAGFGPFLKEEDTLLKSVARHVSRMISDRITADSLKHAERLSALGQLTGGIAHDFNNLLQVVLGNSELLATHLADDAQLGPLASTSLTAARRGADLTNRLLSFARRQTLNPNRTRLPDLLSGMNGLLSRTLGRHVEIDVAAAPDVSDVLIDEAQMENAILNLCINARDAMPGGGKLRIALSNTTIEASDIRRGEDIVPGDYVEIRVSDTGTGIAPEVLARVFDPFFTTKPSGRGSGLGLSMVFGFIRQSQGYIRIASQVGGGTNVHLYLPAVRGTAPAPEPVKEQSAMRGGAESILLVDDDELVRAQVSTLLQTMGYTVTGARNGEDALQIIGARGDFDLVIADIVMPGGLNGFQLAEKVSAANPRLPVLLMSGFSADAAGISGMTHSDYRILRKPFGSRELDESVRRALTNNAQEV